MEIYELREHCERQMNRLPKNSRMYEEHVLILLIINTNQMYRNELDRKNKIIDLMAQAIENYDSQLVINTFKNKEHVKQFFQKKPNISEQKLNRSNYEKYF